MIDGKTAIGRFRYVARNKKWDKAAWRFFPAAPWDGASRPALPVEIVSLEAKPAG